MKTLHKTLLNQLESRLKSKIGMSNENYDLKNLITLIMVFMRSFDNIRGKKLTSFNYFDLLDLFLDHTDLLTLHLQPEKYRKRLEDIGWETDCLVYSYTVLSDIKELVIKAGAKHLLRASNNCELKITDHVEVKRLIEQRIRRIKLNRQRSKNKDRQQP